MPQIPITVYHQMRVLFFKIQYVRLVQIDGFVISGSAVQIRPWAPNFIQPVSAEDN